MRLRIFGCSLSLVIGVFLAGSCSPDEPLIDNGFVETWELLVPTGDESAAITLFERPTNAIVSQNILTNGGGNVEITQPIAAIRSFRDNYYIFVPGEFKIFVVNQETFAMVDILDFSLNEETPSDIAFANATTGFITFEEQSQVKVLDVTTLGDESRNQIAQEIDLGARPVAITAIGNQIYTANRQDNSVSIIDSRDLQVSQTIPVHPNPVFISADNLGLDVVVVSAGEGKFDGDSAPKTPAKVSFIDIITKEVTNVVSIFASRSDSLEGFPYGLAITNADFATVPLQDVVITVDMRNRRSMNVIIDGSFRDIVFNTKRDELILLGDNRRRSVIASAEGIEISSFDLPASATTLAPR